MHQKEQSVPSTRRARLLTVSVSASNLTLTVARVICHKPVCFGSAHDSSARMFLMSLLPRTYVQTLLLCSTFKRFAQKKL